MAVYENCRLFGPYTSGKDGRLRCVLVFPDKRKKTISYPKYLMEKHLDRYLENDETIDHIDGNFLNNDIENLRILPRKQHATHDVLRNKDVEVECAYCGKKFVIEGKMMHNRNRTDKNQSGYFCSRQCSGKYGTDIQNGRLTPMKKDKIYAEKFQLK